MVGQYGPIGRLQPCHHGARSQRRVNTVIEHGPQHVDFGNVQVCNFAKRNGYDPVRRQRLHAHVGPTDGGREHVAAMGRPQGPRFAAQTIIRSGGQTEHAIGPDCQSARIGRHQRRGQRNQQAGRQVLLGRRRQKRRDFAGEHVAVGHDDAGRLPRQASRGVVKHPQGIVGPKDETAP